MMNGFRCTSDSTDVRPVTNGNIQCPFRQQILLSIELFHLDSVINLCDKEGKNIYQEMNRSKLLHLIILSINEFMRKKT